MPFDAVVIGGSHGSFELLLGALPQLAAASMPPTIIVVHIPRGSGPEFVEHYRVRCGCNMVEVEDKQSLEPQTMYLAPGGYHVLVERTRSLSLSSDGPVNHAQPSIDVLFESAAAVFGNRLLGVLLTGASEDGARGLAHIKALGGTVIVQTPGSALAPVMPAAALTHCQPDHIVPGEEIGALVVKLAKMATK